jgi:hypothetical protein
MNKDELTNSVSAMGISGAIITSGLAFLGNKLRDDE